MKKNLTLFFFSLIFSAFLIYFLVFCWVSIFKKYKDVNNFKNLDILNFHKTNSDKLHHLRGKYWPHSKKVDLANKEDYLFTIVKEYAPEKKNILIQGDSWAEYMIFKNNLKNSVDKISQERNIGLINAGVSSFSPSNMKVQYEILEENYKIKPDYLIAIIDQTDIGDELCRYKNKILENVDGSVKQIKREYNTGATLDYSKYYSISEILLSKKSLINFHITNHYFYKTFKELQIKLLNLKNEGWKNRNNYRCKFDQIQKYLFSLDNSEKEYFKERVSQYFTFLDSKQYLKKIFIVTFPHEKHIKNIYNSNVSNIIDEIKLNKKIKHLNFTEIIKNGNFDTKNIYDATDSASHLTEEAHIIYVKKIFDMIYASF